MEQPLALIVEDERDVSLVFSRALQAAGFRTKVVYAGDDALEWLSSAEPDMVVLDLNLPHVVGADVLKYIRSEARLADTPVIVTTAYARLAEGLHDDVDRVLFKPVSFRQLRDLAARLIHKDAVTHDDSATVSDS
jgi:two-component system copper resistance phosphate regulon response regulator CusR